MVLGIVPLLFRFFGVDFLPTPKPWIPIPIWSHWLSGFLVVLPLAMFFIYLSKEAYIEGEGKLFCIFLSMGLFAPFMSGFSVNATLGGTLPMVHTVLFGSEGEIEYTVTNQFSGGSSYHTGCTKGIDVKTNVFAYNSLCGFEWEARNGLNKGSTIKVKGKASRAGVFYESFQVVSY